MFGLKTIHLQVKSKPVRTKPVRNLGVSCCPKCGSLKSSVVPNTTLCAITRLNYTRESLFYFLDFFLKKSRAFIF